MNLIVSDGWGQCRNRIGSYAASDRSDLPLYSEPCSTFRYMNELIVEPCGQHVRCHVDGLCFNNLSYVDDMVSLSESICGPRKLKRLCEVYASGHGLVYNARESQ